MGESSSLSESFSNEALRVLLTPLENAGKHHQQIAASAEGWQGVSGNARAWGRSLSNFSFTKEVAVYELSIPPQKALLVDGENMNPECAIATVCVLLDGRSQATRSFVSRVWRKAQYIYEQSCVMGSLLPKR